MISLLAELLLDSDLNLVEGRRHQTSRVPYVIEVFGLDVVRRVDSAYPDIKRAFLIDGHASLPSSPSPLTVQGYVLWVDQLGHLPRLALVDADVDTDDTPTAPAPTVACDRKSIASVHKEKSSYNALNLTV